MVEVILRNARCNDVIHFYSDLIAVFMVQACCLFVNIPTSIATACCVEGVCDMSLF